MLLWLPCLRAELPRDCGGQMLFRAKSYSTCQAYQCTLQWSGQAAHAQYFRLVFTGARRRVGDRGSRYSPFAAKSLMSTGIDYSLFAAGNDD